MDRAIRCGTAGEDSFCKALNVRYPLHQMNTLPSLFAFAGIGGQEMFLIFLAILLLFGAKKLPEFARGLGRSMGEFKKARQEFEHEITKAVEEKDTKI